jgi:hypothetical protein
MSYLIWRKNGARFSHTDPTTMEAFRTHLEFYHPISKRIARDGTEELYVEGISLKVDTDFLNMLYAPTRGNNMYTQQISDNRFDNYSRSNPVLYTDNGISNT